MNDHEPEKYKDAWRPRWRLRALMWWERRLRPLRRWALMFALGKHGRRALQSSLQYAPVQSARFADMRVRYEGAYYWTGANWAVNLTRLLPPSRAGRIRPGPAE